jgi:Zn2+/Cd2+-exporting ATPase
MTAQPETERYQDSRARRKGATPFREEAHMESLRLKNSHLLLTALSGFGVAIGLILHWTEISETLGKASFLLAVVCSGWFIAPKAWSALKRLSPDMNLLMTVAVLGALAIGAWDEPSIS